MRLPLIEEVVDFATALACAEAVGAMKFANDATLDYLKTRKQFGVPIGTFQALQHRMVDMVIEYEQARSMASLACSKVDSPKRSADREPHRLGGEDQDRRRVRQVSQEAVQLHGGMGMSEELKVSHTFRRLTVLGAAVRRRRPPSGALRAPRLKLEHGNHGGLEFALRPPTLSATTRPPLLCFLHGREQGPPRGLTHAATAHGPLQRGASKRAAEFVIVAPSFRCAAITGIGMRAP